jgi:GT2 family glycosyltransferase
MVSLQGEPQVSIIILNRDGKDLLKRFLPSVFALAYSNYEVIIVDNGSTDGSVELLKKGFPEAKLVKGKSNYTWSQGNSEGAAKAKGDYFWFVNNDVENSPDSLQQLIEFMEANRDVGICAPLAYNYGDKEIIQTAGFSFSRFAQSRALGSGLKNLMTSQPYEVSYAPGLALLMRRSVYEKMGGFDPDLLTLGDDIDISLRCWFQGYRVMVVPVSIVWHMGRATIDRQTKPWRVYNSAGSNLYTMLKNLETGTLITAIPCFLSGHMAAACYHLFLRRTPFYFAAFFKAIAWNMRMLPKILKERKQIQRERRVPDKVFLNLGRNLNGN